MHKTIANLTWYSIFSINYFANVKVIILVVTFAVKNVHFHFVSGRNLRDDFNSLLFLMTSCMALIIATNIFIFNNKEPIELRNYFGNTQSGANNTNRK